MKKGFLFIACSFAVVAGVSGQKVETVPPLVPPLSGPGLREVPKPPGGGHGPGIQPAPIAPPVPGMGPRVPAGGGDPPRPRPARSLPVKERDDNDWQQQVESMMDEWHTETAFKDYLKAVKKLWDESNDDAHAVVFIVYDSDRGGDVGTSFVDQLAAKLVEELEQKAVEEVRTNLASQFAELRKSAHGWFDSAADTERKLAALHRHEQRLKAILDEARLDASARVNQRTSGKMSYERAVSVNFAVSAGTRSSSICLNEGKAMRQAREANRDPSWKTVMKEDRKH